MLRRKKNEISTPEWRALLTRLADYRGMSKRKLAKAIGSSPTYISNWMAGISDADISLKIYIDALEALGVDLTYILQQKINEIGAIEGRGKEVPIHPAVCAWLELIGDDNEICSPEEKAVIINLGTTSNLPQHATVKDILRIQNLLQFGRLLDPPARMRPIKPSKENESSKDPHKDSDDPSTDE